MKQNPDKEQATFDEFVGYLRSALHYLYDPVHLRHSPLIAALSLSQEFDKANRLQQTLIETIQALKPKEDEAPQSSAWRQYDLLSFQYIRQSSRDVVATQLGISERQLRREQRQALEGMAQYMLQNLNINLHKNETPALEIEVESETEPDTGQALSEELAWLKTAGMEQRSALSEVLSNVENLVQPLVQRANVPLHIRIDPAILDILVSQPVITNILLTILNVAIPRAGSGAVEISANRVGDQVEIKVTCCTYEAEPAPFREKENASLETARRLAAYAGAEYSVLDPAGGFAVQLQFPAPEQVPVLVIDDNVDWIEMLKRYAMETRYQVIGIRDPETAHTVAEKLQPSVILLDVMMPNADGWQVMSELRQEQSTHDIPIVVCTILPLEGLALSLGVNAFLQKPVTQDQFLRLLDEVTGHPGEA